MDKNIICILSVLLCQAFGQFSVQPSKDYMVCKPISGVFSTTKTDAKEGSYPVLQGPEGKPGPQGRYGLRGPKGQANYDNVDKIVTDYLQSINLRMYALEKEVEKFPVTYGGSSVAQKPTPSPEQLENEKDCRERFNSPVAVGTMCYNILGAEGLLWTQVKAQSDCEKLGGNLADLDSKELYSALYNLADLRYGTVVQAWTGMRYEDAKLTGRDGTTAIPYAKWTSGYPRKATSSYYTSYKRVYIFIDTSSHVRRLLNARPTDKKSYAICSYNLKGNSTATAIPNTSDVTTAA